MEVDGRMSEPVTDLVSWRIFWHVQARVLSQWRMDRPTGCARLMWKMTVNMMALVGGCVC